MEKIVEPCINFSIRIKTTTTFRGAILNPKGGIFRGTVPQTDREGMGVTDYGKSCRREYSWDGVQGGYRPISAWAEVYPRFSG